jgi:hypothetical protein
MIEPDDSSTQMFGHFCRIQQKALIWRWMQVAQRNKVFDRLAPDQEANALFRANPTGVLHDALADSPHGPSKSSWSAVSRARAE